MDPYKRLKLEYNGISSVIRQYTSRGNIKNFLDELENAIEHGDGEAILYCLSEISKWYTNNYSSIASNHYVSNIEEHNRNKALVLQLYEELKNYDFSILDNNDNIVMNAPKIFLSHCSANIKHGNAIERLLSSLGVKPTQLVYTSHPLHKIPLGENIYEYLRENIVHNVFVIILWSNEYIESPACLSEMGAAWVIQSDYTNIYVPNFDFGNPKYHQCAIDTRKMGAVLNGDANCKANMIELKNKVSEMFDLCVSEQEWTVILDQFIDDIKQPD